MFSQWQLKNTTFWDEMPCRPVLDHWHIKGMHCLHLQGHRVSQANKQEAGRKLMFSKTVCNRVLNCLETLIRNSCITFIEYIKTRLWQKQEIIHPHEKRGTPERCWREDSVAGTGSKFPIKYVQERLKRITTDGYNSDIHCTYKQRTT
jgi:hypothetical protein